MTPNSSKRVEITKDEALNMQWSLIANWKSRADVWPFTYGAGILAGAASLTGIYFNRVSRKSLLLGQHGLRTSFIPTALLPPLFTAIAQAALVSSDILLKAPSGCPSCLETRAVIIQLGIGLLYPVVFSPFTSIYFAKAYGTFDVPNAYRVKELTRLWFSIVKPHLGRIQIFAVCQALLAAAITYQQMAALERIEAKMDQLIVEL